ncbi:MAG: 4-hydroxyphenylacetate 3-hydroxylase [Actinomycetia bacterium]|nr:4-hydroxyphenylacetate 3-hydroxylase [Actinomycetes bacterium]
MGARTGAEYLEGLASTKREIWLGGEMVEDVVAHPHFTQGAHAIAEWYDRQFEFADELLIPDTESGEQINISHMQPRSKEDLERRHVGLRRISEMSLGTMGRTPDYVNVTFAGFADNPTDWRGPDGTNEEGCENIVGFQKRLRRDDLSLTHTIVHPVVDKEKDSQFAGNPVPVHKVGETENGIIVRGARLLATLAPFADEQTVYPGHPLPSDAPNEYALAFTVAMDAPGLIFLCRDSAAQPDAHPFDAPFSTRFDEQDAYCIFDDVEVPRENVWIDGNKGAYNTVMMPSSWWPNIMQQTTIRALTKLEFAYGLATRMAAIVNDISPRTQEMLGEILSYVEATRNSLIAAEAHCKTWPDGGVYPDARAMHPMRAILPTWFTRVNEILKTLGSHNLLAVASRGQLDDARLRPLIDEFLSGAEGYDAEERSAIYRMAWDFLGTTMGSRNELYERNYLASTKTNRIAAHNNYSASARARGDELIEHMLASARARS